MFAGPRNVGAPEASPQRADSPVVQFVGFRLDDEDYAIAITKIQEIILMKPITRIPQMPSFIEGLINLRGIGHPDHQSSGAVRPPPSRVRRRHAHDRRQCPGQDGGMHRGCGDAGHADQSRRDPAATAVRALGLPTIHRRSGEAGRPSPDCPGYRHIVRRRSSLRCRLRRLRRPPSHKSIMFWKRR